MGWLFQNEPLRAPDTPARYLTRDFTYDGEHTAATVLDAAQVGGTVYMAIRNTDKRDGTSYVFAAVVLVRNNMREGFGYKSMDEGMGPCEIDCPDRITRLLSPIETMPDASHAADWRARVAARKAERRTTRRLIARMTPGTIIRLPAPARWTDFQAQDLRVVPPPPGRRGPLFEPLNAPGLLVRLRRAALATALIVAPSG